MRHMPHAPGVQCLACAEQDRRFARTTRSVATGVRRYRYGAPCVCGHTIEQHAVRCEAEGICGCMRFRLDTDR